MILKKLQDTIQYNCDVSDARDNGIYSVCSLILKLRNLYKWENRLAPWNEEDSNVLLDWIADKEEYWETIEQQEYRHLSVNSHNFDPFDVSTVNAYLHDGNYYYWAGYGRSLKSIFFLAEKIDEKNIEGFPVIILDNELNRELASPFALTQEQTIILRKDPLRFFFWDQFQEIQPSSKKTFQHFFKLYGLLDNHGRLNNPLLQCKLDSIVDFEMEAIIYHEVGELQKNPINSTTLKQIINDFSGTSIEYIARGIKDILADTNPKGMLTHIIEQEKETSFCLYVGFLDNLRKILFPEIICACQEFIATGNWDVVETARLKCTEKNNQRAEQLLHIISQRENNSLAEIKNSIETSIITPLDIGSASQ